MTLTKTVSGLIFGTTNDTASHPNRSWVWDMVSGWTDYVNETLVYRLGTSGDYMADCWAGGYTDDTVNGEIRIAHDSSSANQPSGLSLQKTLFIRTYRTGAQGLVFQVDMAPADLGPTMMVYAETTGQNYGTVSGSPGSGSTWLVTPTTPPGGARFFTGHQFAPVAGAAQIWTKPDTIAYNTTWQSPWISETGNLPIWHVGYPEYINWPLPNYPNYDYRKRWNDTDRLAWVDAQFSNATAPELYTHKIYVYDKWCVAFDEPGPAGVYGGSSLLVDGSEEAYAEFLAAELYAGIHVQRESPKTGEARFKNFFLYKNNKVIVTGLYPGWTVKIGYRAGIVDSTGKAQIDLMDQRCPLNAVYIYNGVGKLIYFTSPSGGVFGGDEYVYSGIIPPIPQEEEEITCISQDYYYNNTNASGTMTKDSTGKLFYDEFTGTGSLSSDWTVETGRGTWVKNDGYVTTTGHIWPSGPRPARPAGWTVDVLVGLRYAFAYVNSVTPRDKMVIQVDSNTLWPTDAGPNPPASNYGRWKNVYDGRPVVAMWDVTNRRGYHYGAVRFPSDVPYDIGTVSYADYAQTGWSPIKHFTLSSTPDTVADDMDWVLDAMAGGIIDKYAYITDSDPYYDTARLTRMPVYEDLWYTNKLFVTPTIIEAWYGNNGVFAYTKYTNENANPHAGMSGTGAIASRYCYAGTAPIAKFRKFAMYIDNIIVVNGVPSGYKIKIGEIIVTSTGGTTNVDMVSQSCPLKFIDILDSSDTVICRYQPIDGVWGGDEYTFTGVSADVTLPDYALGLTRIQEGFEYESDFHLYANGLVPNGWEVIGLASRISIQNGKLRILEDDPSDAAIVYRGFQAPGLVIELGFSYWDIETTDTQLVVYFHETFPPDTEIEGYWSYSYIECQRDLYEGGATNSILPTNITTGYGNDQYYNEGYEWYDPTITNGQVMWGKYAAKPGYVAAFNTDVTNYRPSGYVATDDDNGKIEWLAGHYTDTPAHFSIAAVSLYNWWSNLDVEKVYIYKANNIKVLGVPYGWKVKFLDIEEFSFDAMEPVVLELGNRYLHNEPTETIQIYNEAGTLVLETSERIWGGDIWCLGMAGGCTDFTLSDTKDFRVPENKESGIKGRIVFPGPGTGTAVTQY